ncbi:tRNA (adenosine(37)-N6)-threonylcarbamoyltransferase complex dimerization subunit type 1 TsaB [Desulfolucanica intricata]|uniref:tRNA (adenosine(37)-N6)-threonylcarbamoyltransferase complex dimerization subunit type 1 TsaB n=1 Tax=Desulfolucanica intricata TaxID=1285191 RepID=UPI00082EF17A|nr:tRNA (adenosine(37)-N6)-threonylcarbamoyltransferase complex dimerization subunit type 1 TsaB [Desulfolucanica intricata]
MYVLGIEAATPVAAAGIINREKILSERLVNNRRTHSINLLPMIKAVLEDAGLESSDLGGIAVSSGPGSFTGLRIGLATAKTLAQVWELPIVGVSTLDTLAYAFWGHDNLVCPILNARKNEVYTAVYRFSNIHRECLAGPLAISIQELIEILDKYGSRVTFVGDGVPVYQEELIKYFGKRAVFAPPALSFPRGAVTAQLGMEKFKQGLGVKPLDLLPEYLRLSEAEVVWLRKQEALKTENEAGI